MAVFDLLSILKPIPKREFIALIRQIHNNPLRPYGNILLKSPHFIEPASLRGLWTSNDKTVGKNNRNRNLQVVVDLSLPGARTKNYIPSPAFNGLSAVESAVVQMLDEGIQVVRQIE